MRYIVIIFLILFVSCKNIDKNAAVNHFAKQQWLRSEKVILPIEIKDSGLYNVYFIMRHSQRFNYNNIICHLSVDKVSQKVYGLTLNVPLVDKNGKWTGKNMDDLYDHFVNIGVPLLLREGKYNFILQHQMPDDPLLHILNTGIRLKKYTY